MTSTPTPTPIDIDGDGCANAAEGGLDPMLGGSRDAANFWDFFDTPDATNVRDAVVSASDLARVVGRFGGTGDPAIDPLSAPPPAPTYHTAFDRSPPAEAPLGLAHGPNGSVTSSDVALIVAQFGHSCGG
jgi:hypothetical protein